MLTLTMHTVATNNENIGVDCVAIMSGNVSNI